MLYTDHYVKPNYLLNQPTMKRNPPGKRCDYKLKKAVSNPTSLPQKKLVNYKKVLHNIIETHS